LSRRSVLATIFCMIASVPVAGPSFATEANAQAMTEIQNNVFYRAALIAAERSLTRRGQMTDLSEDVRPLFSSLTPGEVVRQLEEIENFVERIRPQQVRMDPEKIFARIEAGETVYLALDEAELKVLFGVKSPFVKNDLVFVALKKQAGSPYVELEGSTLNNKTVYP
jgi:hypothetical protein